MRMFRRMMLSLLLVLSAGQACAQARVNVFVWADTSKACHYWVRPAAVDVTVPLEFNATIDWITVPFEGGPSDVSIALTFAVSGYTPSASGPRVQVDVTPAAANSAYTIAVASTSLGTCSRGTIGGTPQSQTPNIIIHHPS